MSLVDQMAADIETVFINTSDFGVSVVYQRGKLTVPFNAVVDQSQFEVSTESGVTSFETRDYLFVPFRLILADAIRLPERGDLINESGRVYVVTNPAGQPCYRYDDENRLMIRVHTVLKKDA